MYRIAIYGAGGFGKEVRGMLESLPNASAAGYLDDFKDGHLNPDESSFDDVIIAIADPKVRTRIVQSWRHRAVPFAPLVSSDVLLHHSVKVGRGCILCPGTKITVDVSIGEFVIVNLNTTIGHDVVIGDFSSLMPSVNISGNVTIGKGVFIGTGATILQGILVEDDAIIGAGSLVTKNVKKGELVIGIPAKPKI